MIRLTKYFYLIGLLSICLSSVAQYNGHHGNGTLGLRAGSQFPKGWAFSQSIGLSHLYKVVNKDGNKVQLPGSPSVNTFALVPSAIWVTGKKLLGANYAVAVAIPFVNSVLELDSLNVRGKFGLSDLYLQPINLGWHQKWFDCMFAAGVYIPTGRFRNGERTNYGLGMWTYEFETGFTIFPDKKKLWNIATAAWFELNSKKKDAPIQVGDIVTLEGGIGHLFFKRRLNAGISYGSQWKMNRDIRNNETLPGKNHIFSIGPEAGYTFLKGPKPFMVLTCRYLYDATGKATIMGQRFRIIFSFPFLAKKK